MAISNAVSLANFTSGDALTVDSANDRVGIASTVPTTTLDVAGTVKATSFEGSGANLTNVISGVELKQSGNSVGTSITAINFNGASVSTPVAGLATVSVAQNLTIGVRAGTAVTFSISGNTFNVPNRAGGNTSINV
jgi:hypothetical protein|tara:strand:- start:280 stop:687 length:408 start_codon:yes stop_codon:yes gene_type:complete